MSRDQSDADTRRESNQPKPHEGDSLPAVGGPSSRVDGGSPQVPASPLKRLLVQTSHYSFSSVLTMLAGLVSFPILTRIFSVADYGTMNLVAATLSISVAFGKVGIQHSIIRYHSEISAGNGRFTLAQLTSTTLFGMLTTASIVALTLALGMLVVPASWLGGDPRLPYLLAIVAVVVVAQVPESALLNFLRAEQKTTRFMLYQTSKKYAGLALILVAVLLISQTLTAFYLATALTEILAVVILWRIMFRTRPAPALPQFSRPLYRELLKFGVPMLVGYELSGIILSVGDRYVIEGFMGEAPLGLYSAAYNLCQYVQSVFLASVGQAIMPIYMQMWDRQGRDETGKFIARSFRTYVLFGGPVIAGVAAVGPELLPALASDKYVSAAGILPWVIAGMVVDGCNPMLGAGLFIHRKTRIIMSIVMGGALLNLALNMLLIPRMGILGAAVATLVSYTSTALGLGVAGRRLLPVSIPWASMFRTALGSGVMFIAVRSLYPGHRFATVGVRAAVGAALYLVVMTVIDADARALSKKALNRLYRPKRGLSS